MSTCGRALCDECRRFEHGVTWDTEYQAWHCFGCYYNLRFKAAIVKSPQYGKKCAHDGYVVTGCDDCEARVRWLAGA
jgi:hypothetical protein